MVEVKKKKKVDSMGRKKKDDIMLWSNDRWRSHFGLYIAWFFADMTKTL